MTDADAHAVADVLAALASVTPTPAMARLPVLPGEPPLRSRPSAVLDFGFLTTVGDPASDVAVAASVHDM